VPTVPAGMNPGPARAVAPCVRAPAAPPPHREVRACCCPRPGAPRDCPAPKTTHHRRHDGELVYCCGGAPGGMAPGAGRGAPPRSAHLKIPPRMGEGGNSAPRRGRQGRGRSSPDEGRTQGAAGCRARPRRAPEGRAPLGLAWRAPLGVPCCWCALRMQPAPRRRGPGAAGSHARKDGAGNGQVKGGHTQEGKTLLAGARAGGTLDGARRRPRRPRPPPGGAGEPRAPRSLEVPEAEV
jgi:hypothetical protein